MDDASQARNDDKNTYDAQCDLAGSHGRSRGSDPNAQSIEVLRYCKRRHWQVNAVFSAMTTGG